MHNKIVNSKYVVMFYNLQSHSFTNNANLRMQTPKTVIVKEKKEEKKEKKKNN